MTSQDTTQSLKIAVVGTRGVPARYGGFETAVEEIGKRLAARGHSVTVYCRKRADGGSVPSDYLGMKLVTLPAIRFRAAETLSHTALSVLHSCLLKRVDAVFMFNSANAPLLPLLRLRGRPTAVHVDGLEWMRSKWSGSGQRYYRGVESLAVRWADALIADATGIADYYSSEFGARTELISYGATVLHDQADDRLAAMGLEADRFHLVVARFEPENHIAEIVRGYSASNANEPLVVVGGAPYSHLYTAEVRSAAKSDPRIRLLGPVWDQNQLDQLYAHARLYLHGHSVGGTNPSLLRAMGAGTAVCAWDVGFNREVLGPSGSFFTTELDVSRAVEMAEASSSASQVIGDQLKSRVASRYRWDDVADLYEDLAVRLADGKTRRGEVSGRRIPGSAARYPGVEVITPGRSQ